VFGETEDAEVFWCAVGGESADLVVAVVEVVFARGLFPAVESGGRGDFAEASTEGVVGKMDFCFFA